MPWKRRCLRCSGTWTGQIHQEKMLKVQNQADVNKPTTEELDTQKKWADGDSKARTQIDSRSGMPR